MSKLKVQIRETEREMEIRSFIFAGMVLCE